ncbi:hypothetical protein AMS68_007471 [Peltaster fructicola]|uniref:SGS-domain-containing protein n=1 Tax=Peltaster fructicola TaxID=286661 RepID=A0A6H0Y4L4_9PEZI|nr:hypothetical protein AMS68_007471 [Peltaster fructicola]
MATQAAQGKQLLAESKYVEAIEKFTAALTTSPTSPDYLIQRSTAHQRNKQFSEALSDAEAALLHAHTRAKRELIVQAQLRRGIALYMLERYGDAKFALELVKSKDKDEKSVALWLNKAESKMSSLGADDEKSKVTIKEMPDPSVIAAVQAADKESVSSKKSAPPSASEPPKATPMEKIRHEWYQNNNSVFFTLLARGAPQDNTTVDITEHALSISFPSATGSTFDFTIDPLYAPVDPTKSTFRVLASKLEVTLIKATPGQKWSALEGSEPIADQPTEDKPAIPQAVLTAKAPAYPTSSKTGPKNWDKLAGDELGNDEDGDGDDASKFFKQLYKGASPETQRAMMKSYTESNGTALSTDWNDVGKRRIETIPPDGMEAKNWEK